MLSCCPETAIMRACYLPSKFMCSAWVGNRGATLAPVSSRTVACEAKKGKKKKGGQKGNKKGGGLLTDVPKLQPWQKTEVIMQHLLMIESYRWGKHPLCLLRWCKVSHFAWSSIQN